MEREIIRIVNAMNKRTKSDGQKKRNKFKKYLLGAVIYITFVIIAVFLFGSGALNDKIAFASMAAACIIALMPYVIEESAYFLVCEIECYGNFESFFMELIKKANENEMEITDLEIFEYGQKTYIKIHY